MGFCIFDRSGNVLTRHHGIRMKARSVLPYTEIIMEVLLSREELSDGVDRLAALVQNDRGDQPLVLVGVLTGSIMLVADLLRRLDGSIEVGMVSASSYRGVETTPGKLNLHLDLLPDVSQKHVLLVDDIFDTGRTMSALVEAIYARGAVSVKSLVLLRKKSRAEVVMNPDYVGFDIPNVFVVGYGLDHNGAWRNLPQICLMDLPVIF